VKENVNSGNVNPGFTVFLTLKVLSLKGRE
jgi:hypothetical protein